jgi:fused signal recognition particle receptor
MMKLIDSLKFSRLKDGLSKTRDAFVAKVSNLVFAKGKIDDDFIDRLEEILIGADVGLETCEQIIATIKEKVKTQRYQTPEELNSLVKEALISVLTFQGTENGADPFVIPETSRPYVIMIVGVNGVGKTTTIGKLAYNYQTSGKSVIIAAADTFRAAANTQLEIWAQRAGVKIVQQLPGSDPAAVAFDSLESARAHNTDVVIVDTAGRLHTKINLMEELKKIKRVLEKNMPGAPHEVLLVLDAATGQNAIQQARQFNETVGITGLVVTKLDGTAKGGIVLAIAKSMNIPVRFIGVGEQIDDLQPFAPRAFIDALFEKSPD